MRYTIRSMAGALIAVSPLVFSTACQVAEEQVVAEPERSEIGEPERTVTGGEPFHGVLPYRGKDAKLALVRPTFVTAEEAQLADGVSVVGLSIDGSDRAYPLYVLKNHQVVNDRVGDVPVAGSW